MYFPFLIIAFSNCISTNQNTEHPVTWKITTEFNTANNYTIQFEADIHDGWVIYGSQQGQSGPHSTSFTFEEDIHYTLEGNVVEWVKPSAEYDEVLDLTVKKYANEAVFSQNVSSTQINGIVKGKIHYMACDGNKCIPPLDVHFIAQLSN